MLFYYCFYDFNHLFGGELKMRKLVMLFLLVVALSLAGCNQGSNSSSGNLRTFIGGSQGVSVSFEPDSPPSEVNQGDPFSVVVTLQNNGEYDIPKSDYFVELKGFSPADFGVASADDLTVTGEQAGQDLIANALNPDTGEVLESYPVYIQIPLNSNLAFQGAISGNTQLPFVARACYTYQTTADAKLCIKADLKKPRDTNVCTIAGPQAITSSAGPVQITDFKEFSSSTGVRFSFKVLAAATGGKISQAGSQCDHTYANADKVLVKVDTNGLGTVSCIGFFEKVNENDDTEGYVKLSGGSRQVTCNVDLDDSEKADYVKVVTITARYDYEQTAQTSVLIKPQQS